MRILLIGFVAGALAVPLFHQAMVYALYAAGWVPNAPWSLAPTGPFAVPVLVNQMFWGGMWGLVFGLVLMLRPRANVLLVAVLVGLLGAALANLTWIPLLRGQPMPIGDLNRWWRPGAILSAWGLGMGLLFLAMRGRRGAA